MKWWICEDGLVDRSGHWFEYVQTFRKELSSLGDEVQIFSSAGTIPDVCELLDANPALPQSIWARMGDGAPKWRRLLRVPSHGLQTYRSVRKLLSQGVVPDVVFVPAVLVHHLAGWMWLIRGPLAKLDTKILLFFPNTPVFVNGDSTPQLSPEPTAKLFRWHIRQFKSLIMSGKVALGAETRAMREAMEKVCGVPVIYLPHPVRIPRRSINIRNVADLDESPKQSTKLLFGAYGSARYEKGSDILQGAIRLFLERNVTSNVHFAIQWINDFYDAQGNMIQVDSYLRNHPRVKIFDTYFQGNGYLEQVDATDALLLPYRSEYALRVSRVVIEAMIYGKPVIATLGTTLYEQAEEYGAVVPCDDESVESLVRAIETMSYSYPQLKLHANQRAEIAEDHFSVKTFRCSLLAHWGLA